MGEDDGRRIVGQRGFDYFAGIHAGAVDGAAEQFAKLDHPVLVIKQQAGEYLVGVGAHLGSEVLAGQFRAGQRIAALQRFLEMTPGHFHHGLKLDIFGHPEPTTLAESVEVTLQQGAQGTEILQKITRQIHRGLAGEAGTEKDREQLRIRERSGATRHQFLPGSFIIGPVGNRHDRFPPSIFGPSIGQA